MITVDLVTNSPNKVCIQPLSLVSLLSAWKCLVMAPIIPGTPATVSSMIMRLKIIETTNRSINITAILVECKEAFKTPIYPLSVGSLT